MYEPGKMKIKVFTVSKKYFFSISNVFKVYCCSAQKYGANERLRVYYKFTDGSTETVQIASPENLFWPATEISDLKQLKPKPEAYQSADGNILKYVALFKKIQRISRSANSVVGFPQRIKALWVNYDDQESVFTEILFKPHDASGIKITAKGYLTKNQFKVLLIGHAIRL